MLATSRLIAVFRDEPPMLCPSFKEGKDNVLVLPSCFREEVESLTPSRREVLLQTLLRTSFGISQRLVHDHILEWVEEDVLPVEAEDIVRLYERLTVLMTTSWRPPSLFPLERNLHDRLIAACFASPKASLMPGIRENFLP